MYDKLHNRQLDVEIAIAFFDYRWHENFSIVPTGQYRFYLERPDRVDSSLWTAIPVEEGVQLDINTFTLSVPYFASNFSDSQRLYHHLEQKQPIVFKQFTKLMAEHIKALYPNELMFFLMESFNAQLPRLICINALQALADCKQQAPEIVAKLIEFCEPTDEEFELGLDESVEEFESTHTAEELTEMTQKLQDKLREIRRDRPLSS